MTNAQKIARANFKKAIEYRKKTGVSLKEAFAHVKKGVSGYHKDTKSHNVNIRVVSGAKKKVGALPISFSGKVLDIPFKVFHQYDIYNNVASIVEDTNNGSTIVIIDGKGSVQTKANAFESYVLNNSGYSKNEFGADFTRRIKKFVTQLSDEVKKFNAGKSKTIKKIDLSVKAKKVAMPKRSTKKAVKKKAAPVRKKAATKKAAKQTGSSSKFFDKLYQAKKPGKRKTKWGTTYYESRANRSDKGVLLGVSTNMYKMGSINISKLISEIAKESKLKADVVKILKEKAKDYGNDYKLLIQEILQYGLQSGMISELVYYADTTKWYKKHNAEIKKLLREMMMEFGSSNPADLFGKKWDQEDPFAEDTNNQNLLAWFSFEETAREIADRLGYEI